MGWFKKTPQERYEKAFDEALYAGALLQHQITVDCDGQSFTFPRTNEGYEQAAAFLKEHKRPLLTRIINRGRIF
jgi:hypothetical protein